MSILDRFRNGEISRDELTKLAESDPQARQALIEMKRNEERLSEDELERIAAAGVIACPDGDDMIGGGDDNITGVMYGGSGDETMSGGSGDNTMYGGDGDDRMYGVSGDDTMFGGDGDDTMHGGAGSDNMYGGDGDDTLYGGGDAKRDGGSKDQLDGGGGDDTLIGGGGDDTLTGGDGSDTFVFDRSDGNDTVTDFEKGTDIITLDGVTSTGDFSVEVKDGNTVITYGKTTITVEGVELSAQEILAMQE